MGWEVETRKASKDFNQDFTFQLSCDRLKRVH